MSVLEPSLDATLHPRRALLHREAGPVILAANLRATGQIPVVRFATDPAAVKTSLRVLQRGGSGRHLPRGTRETAGHTDYVPPRGGVIDHSFSTPWRVAAQPWPRTREHVLHASALLLEHMRVSQERALARIGRPLPGPLPATERELDPPTGFVQRGAS